MGDIAWMMWHGMTHKLCVGVSQNTTYNNFFLSHNIKNSSLIQKPVSQICQANVWQSENGFVCSGDCLLYWQIKIFISLLILPSKSSILFLVQKSCLLNIKHLSRIVVLSLTILVSLWRTLVVFSSSFTTSLLIFILYIFQRGPFH